MDSGARLAFASDWPVAEMEPLVGIAEAVTRRTADGAASPHRLSVQEAIDAYTRNGAFACRMERVVGTIEAGKYADFVVLSEDPFAIPPEKIRDARVVRTVVGGRTVFDGTSRPTSSI